MIGKLFTGIVHFILLLTKNPIEKIQLFVTIFVKNAFFFG